MTDVHTSGGEPARSSLINNADLDMTGVDPLRIDEVRRRVLEVKSYLALEKPRDADRQRHATALGLSVNQFLALVRAWREHGRAAAISGSGATRGTPRPTAPQNLPTESKAAARTVIKTLGPDVPHVEAVRAVEARCLSLGVKAPSKSTIWNMVMDERRDAGQVAGSGEIVVSRCHAKLPIELDGSIVFPWIVLVVDTADGTVLSATMEDNCCIVPTALFGLKHQRVERGVVMDAEIAMLFNDTNLPEHRSVRPSAARTRTAKALGRGFGSIELIYQLSRATDPVKLLRSRKDSALKPVDAHRIVLEQLTAHNAARGVVAPAVSWRR